MNLVVDIDSLSIHGCGKPLPVSGVEEKSILFCVEGAQCDKDAIGTNVDVEFAATDGTFTLKARLEAVGHGPGSEEYELALKFKRPGKKARSALAALREKFEAAHGFLEPIAAEKLDRPEVLSALGKASGEGPVADIDEVAFSKALAGALGLPFADLEVTGVDVLQARDFEREFLLDHLFMPVVKEGKATKVAVGRILEPRAVAALKRRYGGKVRFMIAAASQIIATIETAYQIRTNRRRAARIAVALRVRIGVYDEDWTLIGGPAEGTTRNISPDGLLVVAQPLVENPKEVLGKRAGVVIYLPEYEDPLRCAGRFLRAKPVSGPESILHSYAVEMNYLPQEDRRRLDVFRYTLLWGPRRMKVED